MEEFYMKMYNPDRLIYYLKKYKYEINIDEYVDDDFIDAL